MKITTFVGRIVERHAVAILIVVLVLSAFAAWSVSRISVVTTQDTFLSAESEAYRGYRAYEEAFGGDSMLILVPGSPLELATPEALQGFTELETQLRADPRIRSVVSPLTLLGPAAAQAGIDLSDPGSAPPSRARGRVSADPAGAVLPQQPRARRRPSGRRSHQ